MMPPKKLTWKEFFIGMAKCYLIYACIIACIGFMYGTYVGLMITGWI